ncbi:hypothetical protein ACE6H2_019601 [Prunus campanulata]
MIEYYYQSVIDDLKKPDYVERVEIKQFSLGDEPLSVRNVERRTSRCVNDLQYQIGLRYTGGAHMLLMLTLKFRIIPIFVPVGVRDFDIDGELWVKLRLIPTEPWVGAVSWAFVSLPKIKFELSPFRLFNLMDTDNFFLLSAFLCMYWANSAIPVLSMCGYDQKYFGPVTPATAGVIGLGNGKCQCYYSRDAEDDDAEYSCFFFFLLHQQEMERYALSSL